MRRHVRRGDYLNYHDVLPVLPIEYYASADRAVRQWNVERFVVYTDDAAWVRLHLLPRFQSYRMELSTQRGAIDDFVGLTECRWLITANSTFSVTAAILADPGVQQAAQLGQPELGSRQRHHSELIRV
jgi:hypothetical protein